MTTSTKAKWPANFFNVVDAHEVFHGSDSLRDWKDVKGIVLHQTACRLGTNVERWYSVTCHVGCPSDGKVIFNNDLRRTLWHGHGFNRDTVGIEIDGNYQGIDGNDATRWKAGGGPAHLTKEQLEAARAAVAWIVAEVAANGGKITHIWAHRQSSDQRQSDPGSEIWTGVGLWAQRELGLINNPGVTLGTGMALSVEWDERSVWDWFGRLSRDGWRRIQHTLNTLKCSNPLLEEDGLCGRKTKQALREFQHRKGLVQDMVFGPKTWAAWAEEAYKEEEKKEPAVPVAPEDWNDPDVKDRAGTVAEAGWTPEGDEVGKDPDQPVWDSLDGKAEPKTRKLPKPS